MTGNHEMYKVFTPFKNAFLRRLKEDLPVCVAAPSVRQSGRTIGAEPIVLNYPQQDFDNTLFPADEKSAIARLRHFCQQLAGGV